MSGEVAIRRLLRISEAEIEGLASVLIDCVEGGASVSFMLPLSRERAEGFWRRIGEGVADGTRAVLVAEDGEGICGTVQLSFDLPENQPHRADLAKLLVHARARRRGVGEALMREVLGTARDRGKTVLVLDAVTDGPAARLYERLGWVKVGEVPRYALTPDGAWCAKNYYSIDLGE